MYSYKAKLIRIVDADTVDLLVDLGFKVLHVVRVRLLDVDAPEIYGVKRDSDEFYNGKRATEFVRGWFDNASTLSLKTIKAGQDGNWLGVISKETTGEIAIGYDAMTLNDALKLWINRQEQGK